MKTELRKWLAYGTGIGIQIGKTDLQVTIARVRPSGIAVLGSATVADYENRPASEWGRELQQFFRKLGCAHVAAAATLPRSEVIVRQIAMPGVANKDLASAVSLQLDTLHPYTEDEVLHCFARIGRTPNVLIGVARREVIDRYSNLFTEAGIKIASFTFSAAAFYTALRMYSEPAGAFAAYREEPHGEFEIYGESEARPVFSASFEQSSHRALHYALSELRLASDQQAQPMHELLPAPVVFPLDHQPEAEENEGPPVDPHRGLAAHTLPYATALAAACPWQGISSNLLPVSMRRSSSRMRFVPTLILLAVLLSLTGALVAQARYEKDHYGRTVLKEIQRLEPSARRLESLDREISHTRARTQLLDDFRRRSKADMDALSELTRLLPPPTWVNALEIRREGIQLNGETEQAAALIKVIDGSPMFENTEFTMPYARGGIGEIFGIRASRRKDVPKP